MAEVSEEARRRWFRFTPDRCVLGLLALEGLLLLSQWFRWFPFNQHKGWTVLICLAMVGVALFLMFLWFLAALIFRLRFQFSILSLLLLVVVVAVPFAWLETKMNAARKQREAMDWIEKAGGGVFYDYELPGPVWLRNLVGNVTWVQPGKSGVSDAWLEHLKGLTQLRILDLNHTNVSNVGLDHLKGLPQLQQLRLDSTNVSDAGLQHLEGLTQLQELHLDHTKITDAGLQHLKGLAQLRWLDLDNTTISDAGLQHLKLSTRLQWLILWNTNVTDAGVKKLQKALPNSKIEH